MRAVLSEARQGRLIASPADFFLSPLSQFRSLFWERAALQVLLKPPTGAHPDTESLRQRARLSHKASSSAHVHFSTRDMCLTQAKKRLCKAEFVYFQLLLFRAQPQCRPNPIQIGAAVHHRHCIRAVKNKMARV